MMNRNDPAEESALCGPLRPTDPVAMSTKESTPAGTDGTAERTQTRHRISDPRAALGLSDRDLAVLGFVATAPFVAQYQIRERFFRGVSEVPGSRCVRRLLGLGLILIQRWRNVGINLVRTTEAGHAAAMTYAGLCEEDVFVSRWPSISSLSHTLWILDAAIAIGELATAEVTPCWALRRRSAGTNQPVPDLLVRTGNGRRVVILEVDLGTENLKRVVLPKIDLLRSAAKQWVTPGSRAAILILTLGPRRRESLVRQIPVGDLQVQVVLLPDAAGGQPAIEGLRKMFSGL